MRKKIIRLKSDQYHTLLTGYQKHVAILGYSEAGQRIKYTNVAEFLAWLEKEGIAEIKAVHPVTIKTYHEHLKNRPNQRQEGVLNLKTVTSSMHNLRVFFAWLQESGMLVTSPISALKFEYPQQEKTERTVLSLGEIRELYKNTENLQERVILSLAYGCGLRAMEMVSVNLDEIKINEGILIIPKGKGNKRRVVPMSNQVQQDIRNYMDNERDLYLKDDRQKALLLNIKGERMRKYTSRKILQKLIRRTGNKSIIRKNISIHNLRHSIATHLLEQGVPVEQVRQFLGHSHLETTEIYTRVNQQQLKELIQ